MVMVYLFGYHLQPHFLHVQLYIIKLNFKRDDVISVGDGANDINFIKHSDIGVSYKGKQILNNQADVVFNHTNLEGILYLQDYKI